MHINFKGDTLNVRYEPQASVKAMVKDCAYRTTSYLVKFMVLDANDELRKLWKDLVYKYFNSIPLMYETGDTPTGQEMFGWFWVNDVMKELEWIINRAIRDFVVEMPLKRYNKVEISNTLRLYFLWLTGKLSENTTVSKEEVFEELDHLGIS